MISINRGLRNTSCILYKVLMVEITFKDNKIQKGHRIKIPKAIIDTLNLKEGSKIILKFDPINKKIIIEEDKK